MASSNDKVRMQTMVERKLAERIRDLAQRMTLSESAFMSLLLEAAVDDNEWIIRAATSQLAKKLSRALGIAGTDRQRFESVEHDVSESEQRENERAA